MLESFRINAEIRRLLKKRGKFEEVLGECLLLSDRISSKNVYIRRFLESVSVSSVSADPRVPRTKCFAIVGVRFLRAPKRTRRLPRTFQSMRSCPGYLSVRLCL